MNEMMSLGDVGGGWDSANNDCKGVADDAPRARVKVCRNEANPRVFGEVDGCGVGDGGRLTCVGDIGTPPFEVGVEAVPFAFFLPDANDRNNDHSPSN